MAEAQDGISLRVQPEQVRELVLGLVRQPHGHGPIQLLLALTGYGRQTTLEDFVGDSDYESNITSQAVIHAPIVSRASGSSPDSHLLTRASIAACGTLRRH